MASDAVLVYLMLIRNGRFSPVPFEARWRCPWIDSHSSSFFLFECFFQKEQHRRWTQGRRAGGSAWRWALVLSLRHCCYFSSTSLPLSFASTVSTSCATQQTGMEVQWGVFSYSDVLVFELPVDLGETLLLSAPRFFFFFLTPLLIIFSFHVGLL